MMCQILFAGINKKNFINMLSADLAKRVVKVKMNGCLKEFAGILQRETTFTDMKLLFCA